MSDLFRSLLLATAHWCGGSLGGAIFLVSFAVRLLMLPLALHMARRAREQAAILALLKPRLDSLQAQHAKDPVALWQATRAVHREAGYRPFSIAGMLGLLVQWPLMAALFAAMRQGLGARVGFLWAADLARPDRWLVVIATLLAAGASAALMPASVAKGTRETMIVLPAVMTFAFLWFASSGLAISYGAGSLVGVLQGLLQRRQLAMAAVRR